MSNPSTAVTAPIQPVQPFVTPEQLAAVLPPNMKKRVNQEVIDNITAVLNEPDMYEAYRDNLLSYTNVLKEGKYQISQYVSAVKYVSHKLRGCTNIDAFVKTFPDRYQDYLARGVSSADISSYVHAYNKTQLVMKITEQSLIPPHVLNNAVFQEAINVQAELMRSAKSEKVRSDAADSIMKHLAPPQATKIELDIAVKEDDALAALKQASMDLAQSQMVAARTGAMTARDLAESRIVVDVESREVS